MEEKIWFALVGITPLKGNELTPKATGAYVRIAYRSTKNNFRKHLEGIFKDYHYSIFEITDIKSHDSLNDDDKSNETTQELLTKIDNGLKFAWGTFHTWK